MRATLVNRCCGTSAVQLLGMQAASLQHRATTLPKVGRIRPGLQRAWASIAVDTGPDPNISWEASVKNGPESTSL